MGHKSQMKEVLAGHADVAACAVIGVHDQLKGQVPVGFVVLKGTVDREPVDIAGELVALVRNQIGAVASLKRVEIVPHLPKTRSGKILRVTMRSIADGKETATSSTIDDPTILDEIRTTLGRTPG